MIEDLNLINIDKNICNILVDTLGYNDAFNLACNYELVNANIDLLKSYGINVIDKLLLNKQYIFLNDTDKLSERLSRIETSNFADLVNEDYTVIDEIFI